MPGERLTINADGEVTAIDAPAKEFAIILEELIDDFITSAPDEAAARDEVLAELRLKVVGMAAEQDRDDNP